MVGRRASRHGGGLAIQEMVDFLAGAKGLTKQQAYQLVITKGCATSHPKSPICGKAALCYRARLGMGFPFRL